MQPAACIAAPPTDAACGVNRGRRHMAGRASEVRYRQTRCMWFVAFNCSDRHHSLAYRLLGELEWQWGEVDLKHHTVRIDTQDFIKITTSKLRQLEL